MASGGELGAGPVRHIVMLKVGDKANVATVASNLAVMAKGLPGVSWSSFRVDTDLGLVETNYDVVLVVDFLDKENFFAYAKHPEHLSAIHSNTNFVEKRCAIQFSLGAKL